MPDTSERDTSERDTSDTRAIVERMVAETGFMALLGVEVVDAKPGDVTLAVDRRPQLTQFAGFFHAGAIAGLADHAAGGAAWSLQPEGRGVVTLNFQFDFLAPAKGERLLARARVLRAGGTIVVVRAEVFSQEAGAETLCAAATVTLRSVRLA
ncbi:MAG: PaaI family thioesterase [Hyphomonadaceae bacterium]